MRDFYCEQVLSGEVPVEVVHQSERILAFHHTRPMFETHIVVIPRFHIESLLTVDEPDLMLELMSMIQLVASDVLANSQVCKIVTNLGDFQESKHLHWHVISRPLAKNA